MSIRDARELADGETLRGDICIVGAGPAGITLARQLNGHGLDVMVLEGGGEAPDPQVRDLYAGSNEGDPYYALDVTRLRYFGGSTNHWEGYCKPLDEEDFTTPLVDALGAWPFGLDELEDHYAEAARLCGIDDSLDVSGETWAARAGTSLLPTDPDVMNTEILLRGPPVRFGDQHREELAASDDVTVYLYANVVDLVTDEQRVRQVRIAHFGGATQMVEAEIFVLATGGIEIPRLMLASGGPTGAGIGNANDLVGRFFMEHPHLGGLHLVCPNADAFPFYTEESEVDGQAVNPILTIPPSVRQARGIGNVAASLMQPGPIAAGYLAGDQLTGAVRGLLRDGAGYQTPDHLRVQLMAEQVPNARSRIRLLSERDELGLPRCSLRWELHEADHHTLRVAAEVVAGQLAALGLGRLSASTHGSSTPYVYGGGHHHMGTTRMHEDSRRGVVDSDSRVHGTENLYVASSSVFPTGGYANPTLTIVALALRLGEHLREGA